MRESSNVIMYPAFRISGEGHRAEVFCFSLV